MRIEEIEGIGPVHGAKLTAVGVATTEALLEQGATAGGRRHLAETTGISETAILEWVNHVDLMRIDGVGPEYSDLLEAAGVDSPAELAQRNAANLAETLQEVVAARPGIVRRIPGEDEVAGWIAQAATLPKVVSHGGGGAAPAAAATTGAPPAAAAPAEPAAAAPAPAPADASQAAATPAQKRTPAAGAGTGSGGAAPSAATDNGLWARIKRLFGGS
jgi:predicted flap endonuclease-1-like 5' DNA nuclease